MFSGVTKQPQPNTTWVCCRVPNKIQVVTAYCVLTTVVNCVSSVCCYEKKLKRIAAVLQMY